MLGGIYYITRRKTKYVSTLRSKAAQANKLKRFGGGGGELEGWGIEVGYK